MTQNKSRTKQIWSRLEWRLVPLLKRAAMQAGMSIAAFVAYCIEEKLREFYPDQV